MLYLINLNWRKIFTICVLAATLCLHASNKTEIMQFLSGMVLKSLFLVTFMVMSKNQIDKYNRKWLFFFFLIFYFVILKSQGLLPLASCANPGFWLCEDNLVLLIHRLADMEYWADSDDKLPGDMWFEIARRLDEPVDLYRVSRFSKSSELGGKQIQFKIDIYILFSARFIFIITPTFVVTTRYFSY